MTSHLNLLLKQVRDCRICAQHLPLGPRPVLQLSNQSRLLIAGQAPGRKVHETGLPFDDPSGKRLREWMGVSDDATFYNADQIAILPDGFLLSQEPANRVTLPPRPECATTWREGITQIRQRKLK